MSSSKTVLLILDGWGIAADKTLSAIDAAHTPGVDALHENYPHTQLIASGKAVGLPEGQMGNSEVGHLHLGAGRVVLQTLPRINHAIAAGELARNTTLCEAFAHARTQGKNVHLLGLVSDGGVHAHVNHVKALTTLAQAQGVEKCFVHAFTDGRDTPPCSGLGYLTDLQQHLAQTTGQLATIMGRYYAMDRDQRWERTQVAYEALTQGKGAPTKDWGAALKAAYKGGTTDEFLSPLVLTDDQGEALPRIQPGDVVICFNFRPDRMRQLTAVLTQRPLPTHNMVPLPLHYVTFTSYDTAFHELHVVLDHPVLTDTLGEVVSAGGKTQARIAETEKYAHVTYFFSGGREAPFPGEARVLCPSPQVATYDLAPKMSAEAVTRAAVQQLAGPAPDLVVVNLANADMVGHTGKWEATIAACEEVDRCCTIITHAALERGYGTLIVADHGNADQVRTADGQPFTAHTNQPVPCLWVHAQASRVQLQPGTLADVAPTLLHHLRLPIPSAMTGNSLLKK